jgi:tetratricopeptide (TPR) repeat protein
MPANCRVFLSCVSTEFRSYRLWLANQLGALRGRPYEVKVQEDFQQGGYTLLDQLSDYIEGCDLVIHLVGDLAGARPTAEHERTLLHNLGESENIPLPGWSYTQWEYRLARRFQKKVLVYFARQEAPRDCGQPVQSNEDAELQKAHIKRIHDSGEHWKEFADCHALIKEVFFDLGLEPDRKVNNLPYKTLGSLFKGREEFLEQISATLSQAEYRGHKRAAAITASVTAATVHGLGGIGKTRAAIEFAHRHADDYTALLFVRADSPEGIKANLAALCGPLVLDLAEKDATELDVQVAAALHWLQQHPGWLLILDNVDTEPAAKAVEDLLGQLSHSGQVLITSRISRWSAAVVPLALDVLTESDAADFLLERTEKSRRQQPDDPEQARVLARTLGQLALALEQAGAMIYAERLSFAQYLEYWHVRHERVLTWFNERLMQYPVSVAVTWQTSFDQLTKPARKLLYQLAWLAPDPIPEFLLEVEFNAPEKGSQNSEAPVAKTGNFDSFVELENFSLVTRSDDRPYFSVHRLVQDVTRRSLQGDVEHHDLKATLSWINAAFVGDPQDVRNWPVLDPLASHAQACARFADEVHITNPTARLMNQLGILLLTKAEYTGAEPLMRRALAIDEASFGNDHPRVAIDLNNLAQLLQATNRLAEAEPLMRRALAIDEASFGKDHPRVAIDLNNLASLLKATNRLAEAEPLMRRVVSILLEFLCVTGYQHPHLNDAIRNYASLLAQMGYSQEQIDDNLNDLASQFGLSFGEG